MRFAILFPLLSAGLCLIARRHGGLSWLLLWPALSFFIVGLAYALSDPRFFGKHADGKMAWWSLLLLFPYVVFSWLLWHLVRLVHRLLSAEPYASQVFPELWVSRRLTLAEVPPGVTCVVDLTCEFPATHGLAKSIPHYFCLPTLDYGAPQPDQMRDLIAKLRSLKGGIVIHCAQGHGRSALFAAAYLVATGSASGADEALQLLKLKRPNVRLSRRQRLAIAQLNGGIK